MEVISTALKNGDKVNLRGFGTFLIVDRKARIGRNPRNGDEIMIPEKTAVKFKPSPFIENPLNEIKQVKI